MIDADPVNYSVFSRNLDLSYAKEKKEKLAYNIVRMIVELANRDDIQISHKNILRVLSTTSTTILWAAS